jgi:hypothetical protein
MGFAQFVLGALGAALAWMITEFLARPFRHLFELRRETARRMIQFGDGQAGRSAGGLHGK